METSKLTEEVERVLEGEVETIVDAVQRVRDLADGAEGETEQTLRDVARDLRNAAELVRCLRFLVAGRTLQELHAAFGSPGDWGYGTPLGHALARLYAGKGDAR